MNELIYAAEIIGMSVLILIGVYIFLYITDKNKK